MMTKKIILLLTFVLVFGLSTAISQAAHFNLDPGTGEYKKDDEFEVKLILDTTGKQTSGVDVIINYPWDILELTNVSFNSLYLLNDAKYTASGGVVSIFSTMTGANSFYNGSDTLATLKFKGKTGGSANVYVKCLDNETTTDSNIWESGGIDIINCSLLNNANFTIDASCPTPAVPADVKAESGPDSGEVIVSWDKVDNADYYNIAYGQASLDYQWGSPNLGDVDEYTVTNLTPGGPYYFIVAAVNSCGSSGALQEVAAYAGKSEDDTTITPAASLTPQVFSSPIAESKLETEPQPEASGLAAAPVFWGAGKPSPTAVAIQTEQDKNEKIGFIAAIKDLLSDSIIKWVGIIGILLTTLSIIGKNILEKSKK
ncbi:fibronectin type III domain-containing protein [Patescibacteria group bacterium]